MIRYFEIPIGAGGGTGCTVCARSLAAAPEAYPAGLVAAAIEDAAASFAPGRFEGVAFTGFEPFAHPELPALIEAAVRAGAQRVCLRTDGGALSKSANAAGALAAGVTHLDVVMLADGEEHDRLVGVMGLSLACRAGVMAFTEEASTAGRRIAITGRVPVCRHSAAQSARAVGRLAALGAVAVCIDATSAGRSAREHVTAALETAAVNGMHGWALGLDTGEHHLGSTPPWREVRAVGS